MGIKRWRCTGNELISSNISRGALSHEHIRFYSGISIMLFIPCERDGGTYHLEELQRPIP